ncbi:MAG: hypothetical protein M3P93_00640 [Actinomycetota bacterium]|nr:hypothetical protein [Actinomycetota bacterium]
MTRPTSVGTSSPAQTANTTAVGVVLGGPSRAAGSASAARGTTTSAKAYQRSPDGGVTARRQRSRTPAGPSTRRVSTRAGRSSPTSVLALTNGATGSATP